MPLKVVSEPTPEILWIDEDHNTVWNRHPLATTQSPATFEILGPALSPAKSAKQKRFLEGVAHGTIHRKGITPQDAKKALGEGETKPKKKGKKGE